MNKAFTLIEITIVVAIILIITAIALPNINTQGAKIAKEKQLVNTLNTALNHCILNDDPNIETLILSGNSTAIVAYLISQGYVRQIP